MNNRKNPSQSSLERVSELELELKELKETPNSSSDQKAKNLRNELISLKIKLNMVSDEEKFFFIGDLMENALYVKTGEYRDSNAATYVYKNILQIDRDNPEAHYRYAYLQYDKKHWLKTIEHFQLAIDINRKNTSNFPLGEDQIIKAKLFIGYSAAQIYKEARKEANGLDANAFALSYEGISIEELSNQLKQELEKKDLNMITPNGKQGISQEKYGELRDSLSEEQLLLSFVEDRPFIQFGDDTGNPVTPTDSVLLKKLLMKSVNNKALSLVELNGFDSETGTINEVSRSAYRQQIKRLNNRLKESGMEEGIIKLDAGLQRYRIEIKDFYIVSREDQYL
jgi:hypothetical protein